MTTGPYAAGKSQVGKDLSDMVSERSLGGAFAVQEPAMAGFHSLPHNHVKCYSFLEVFKNKSCERRLQLVNLQMFPYCRHRCKAPILQNKKEHSPINWCRAAGTNAFINLPLSLMRYFHKFCCIMTMAGGHKYIVSCGKPMQVPAK